VRKELMAASYARGLWTFPIDSVFAIPTAPAVAVRGIVETEAGQPVAQVIVCNQPQQVTGPPGTFEILAGAACLAGGLNPKRDGSPLNGVSTFDLVLINRHILGIETLNSPYKMIAADVNNSRSVSTADIVALRKLILGIDTDLTNVDSWRFVPADFTFPNPQNPFQTVFPEGVAVTPGAAPQVSNFIGLKVGDVNGNALPELIGPAEVRFANDWDLYAQDRSFAPGEEIRVVFSAEWTEVAGAQFTLSFDPQALSLSRIEPLSTGIKSDHFALRPGGRNCVTACLENPQGKRSSGSGGRTDLFAVVIRSKTSGSLHDALRLVSSPTPGAAFRAEGTALQPALVWENPVQSTQPAPEVYPNPFGQAGIWLRQNEHSDAKTTLRVFDSGGKLILEKTWNGAQEHIPASAFPQKGVYWYELRQGARRWSGKMVFQGG